MVQPVSAIAVAAPPVVIPAVRFTDGVLDAIHERLATIDPEHGGALFEAGGLVHLFVDDTSGRYSRASWDISPELSEVVGVLERRGHGALAGTVHSHPAGIADPSGTDIRTTAHALRMNPHLHRLVIAVVTQGRPRSYDLPIGKTHRMSVHVLTRDGDGDPVLVRSRGVRVALSVDLGAADVPLPSETSVRAWIPRTPKRGKAAPDALPHVVDVSGRSRLVVPVPASEPYALLIDAEYPVVGPVLVRAEVTRDDVRLVPRPSPWDQVGAPAPQMAALVQGAATGRRRGATDRVDALVGSLSDRRAVVIGLGSVGSRLAEDLVRSGLGRIAVIDPDVVEAPNLSRTTYVAADVGSAKASALARRLRAIDPSVEVEEYVAHAIELDLDRILTSASLVVAATDDMPQQAVVSHHAYVAGVPLVACALYRAGAAGEVVLSVPQARTACWSCAVGEESAADRRRPDKDYGTGGRLAGEIALGPAIHLVTDVASQIALGLLAGPDTPAGNRVTRLLARRQTLGLVATAPAWDFFPRVFGDMAHQDAPQSVWVTVPRRDDCPACGTHPERPASVEQGAELVALIESLSQEARTARHAATRPRSRRAPRVVTRIAAVMVGLTRRLRHGLARRKGGDDGYLRALRSEDPRREMPRLQQEEEVGRQYSRSSISVPRGTRCRRRTTRTHALPSRSRRRGAR